MEFAMRASVSAVLCYCHARLVDLFSLEEVY